MGALIWGVALTGCKPHPAGLLYFALAALVVLLVHEMGHALVGKRFMGQPYEVRLSFRGGLCRRLSEPSDELPTRRAVLCTVLAGPVTGIVLSLLLCLGLVAVTGSVAGALELGARMLGGEVPMEYAGVCPPLLLLQGVYLLQISVFWTLLNLLPLYPLDGGLVICELMEAKGWNIALTISLVMAIVLAVVFFALGIWALSALMLLLAYMSYRSIGISMDE